MKSEFSIDDQNSLTKKTYSAINMYLLYDDQVNQLFFDDNASLCFYRRSQLEVETAFFWFDETEPDMGTGYANVCKDGNTALDVMNDSYTYNADIILTAHTKVQDNKWWITGQCLRKNAASHWSLSPIAQGKKPQRSPIRLRFFPCTLEERSGVTARVLSKRYP